MNKFVTAFLNWCHDPSPEARFTRTVAQGIIGILVSGLATNEWGAAAIVGLIMAILSPVQAEIAKGQEETEEE